MPQGQRRAAHILGLAAGMVVCLLILQAHATLHLDAGTRPLGQRVPVQHSHGSDCQICASNHWVTPEFSPQVASLHMSGALETLLPPFPGHASEFRQTAPRAPPQG